MGQVTSGPDPSPQRSQREMLLIYLGYLPAVEGIQPTAEQRSEQQIRRGVMLVFILALLVLIGLALGPIAVLVVVAVASIGWALMTRADRRRQTLDQVR